MNYFLGIILSVLFILFYKPQLVEGNGYETRQTSKG